MTGLISPQLIEQIRAASDIVDVIGGYLPLKRAGANFVALCPFHREKTPSFHVNPQRQIFHCFGCQKGGDVFAFVREYESLSFVEAVRRLAERARIPIEFEQEPGERQRRFRKDTLLEMHEQITQRWQAVLNNDAAGQVARDYLIGRGVRAEAVRLFRLGYAPDAWDDTVNWAKSKGYDPAIVEEAGLITRKPGEGGTFGRHYDRFRGRLMFPICDEQGRVIAFSGRILSGDEKTAKYVNSPETPIFTKGRVLFGLDKSKRAILDAGRVIVCEGQLDLMACYMAGVQNVVAPQGTALTGDHCHVLKRYVDEAVLCFDSDVAGQKAALRALDDLLQSGLAIRVATIPAPHDPDSFIRDRGAEAFRNLIESAQGFFDYLLDRLVAANDAATDRGRMAIVRGMAENLHKTGNAVLVDTYAQKTAQRLGVSIEAVRAEFRKGPRPLPARRETTDASASSGPAAARPAPQESWLLRLLMGNDALVPLVADRLDLNWLQHPAVRGLIQRRLEAEAGGTWRGVAVFLGQFEDARSRQLITEAVSENLGMADPERLLHDVLRRLRDTALDREIVQVNRQIADSALSDAQRFELLRRKQGLVVAKQAPLRPA